MSPKSKSPISSGKTTPEQVTSTKQPDEATPAFEQAKQATLSRKNSMQAKPATTATKKPVQPKLSTPATEKPGKLKQTPLTNQPEQPNPKTLATKLQGRSKQSASILKLPAKGKFDEPYKYERFDWMQRIAHALLLSTFILLAITGLPQEFALAGWAQAMIGFFGGIAAVVLILLGIYHLLDVGYKIFVRRTSLSMLPTFKDVKDALQAFIYNLGFGKTRPQMGRYTFEEKAEYWALIWGVVIMAITGAMMWNPIFTTRILPGEIIPAAKAAHGGEALLAVMAIVVWHMYGVHIRRFNKAMWTGKQTEEEMLHEHPLELADIKAGLAGRLMDAKILHKRRTVYFPIASVLAVVMLLGLYGFVTGEKTAITTVLPISSPVAIYVPETPTPMPTPLPSSTPASAGSGALTWDATIGPLFHTKCSMCHGSAVQTNGLSFATYADALKGAQDGVVIIPGNVENSKLIVIQSANNHPGQLSADQLAEVKQWIALGAPEK
jgi:cytochrome b subunit of formate dehydrogenase/cytochrome c551/c552